MFKVILMVGIFSVSAQAQQSTYELEEINISGAAEKVQREVVELPVQVDIVSSSEIEENQDNSLKGALNGKSDVEFVGGPRATIQKPQIRGLGDDRVLLVVDGVKQNFGTAHSGSVFTDLSLFKSVEVIKGSGSTLYGSSALGGVISLQRKTASDYLTGVDNLGAELSSSHDSAASGANNRGTVYGRTKNKKVGVVATYSKSKNGNLTLGGGEELEYSESEIDSLSTTVSINPREDQSISFTAEKFEESGLWPSNPAAEVSRNNGIAETLNERQSYQMNYNFNPKSEWLNVSMGVYENSVDVVTTNVSDGIAESMQTTSQGIEVNNTSEVVVGEGIVSSTLGMEYISDVNSGLKGGLENNRYPNGQSDLTSIYLQPTYELVEKFRVVPGVRYDSYRITTEGSQAKLEDQLTSKLALMYFVKPNLSIYSSYGEGFKAPKIQETYIYGEHFRVPSKHGMMVNNFVPNPDLTSEKTQTYEVGTHYELVKGKRNSVKVHASIYETQAQDFVERDIDMRAGTTQFINRDEVLLKGGELALSASQGIFSGRVAYTKVRSENILTSQPLADTPADKVSLSASMVASEKNNLKIGTLVSHYEAQDLVPVGGHTVVNPTGSYYVQDLYLSIQPKLKIFEKTRLGLRVNNIHDREYQQHGSPFKGIGRDIRFTATINL
ncbi:MAG: TonB-dependent receptor [Bdellovibrionaceae bacterium]|jgi:hemoglobin/transferrin/lactoferrin receptor protein|nr:TonB-dependent receptor [Pseudobdellovibrionaceae bacterium]